MSDEPWIPILRDANARMSAPLAGRSVWSADIGDRRLEVLELSVVIDEDPPEYVVEAFGPLRAVLRDRVYAVDGRRVQWARTWLPADLAERNPLSALDTGPGGVPARLAELGHAPARFVEDVEFAAPADFEPDERDRLANGVDIAVVRILRISVDAEGRIVEIADMRLVASAYRFRWTWDNSA
jgi:GntR family transcriptional regulator